MARTVIQIAADPSYHLAVRGSRRHRLPLVALVLQWRQNYPDNRPPTPATAISAVGQNPPPALQKRWGLKARHAAPFAVGSCNKQP